MEGAGVTGVGVTAIRVLRVKRICAAGELSDDQLLDAMIETPILINRPFVVTPMGTRLARPSEVVLDILPADAFKGPFSKEDGEQVLDEEGKRIV